MLSSRISVVATALMVRAALKVTISEQNPLRCLSRVSSKRPIRRNPDADCRFVHLGQAFTESHELPRRSS